MTWLILEFTYSRRRLITWQKIFTITEGLENLSALKSGARVPVYKAKEKNQ